MTIQRKVRNLRIISQRKNEPNDTKKITRSSKLNVKLR